MESGGVAIGDRSCWKGVVLAAVGVVGSTLSLSVRVESAPSCRNTGGGASVVPSWRLRCGNATPADEGLGKLEDPRDGVGEGESEEREEEREDDEEDVGEEARRGAADGSLRMSIGEDEAEAEAEAVAVAAEEVAAAGITTGDAASCA